MSWQAASLVLLGIALAGGFAWYEREKPPARVVAVVAALAALAVVGRLAFAAIPNVKPTTDIVLFAGYALGAVPGFAVGAVTAIVSNIFLSQGPWTVWQMAGWGAVGVGGALLARLLRHREPSRLLLAAVCGLAGRAGSCERHHPALPRPGARAVRGRRRDAERARRALPPARAERGRRLRR